MSKKPPGREPLAASQARMQELLQLLQDLAAEHEFHMRAYAKTRNEILQLLAKEPAYQAMEKDVVRASAVREAHDQGDKLTIDGQPTARAFKKASEKSGSIYKGGPDTMRAAHKKRQKHQRGVLEATNKAVELSKKLRLRKGKINHN